MLKIGLTGNYYSGQNEVSEIFEKMGVKVFDADLILKYLINYSSPHIEKIKENFGENVYHFGLLKFNRFKSNKNWDDLIDLLEFDLIKSYEKFRLQHKEEFYTVFKYSILFERNIEKSMDSVINCYKPKYYRRTDIENLTYMDSKAVEYLMDNEMDETIKNKKSHYLVNNFKTTNNDDNFIHLDSKVENIHRIIMNKKPQEEKFSGSVYSSGFWD